MWLLKMLSRQGCEAEKKLEKTRTKESRRKRRVKVSLVGGWSGRTSGPLLQQLPLARCPEMALYK